MDEQAAAQRRAKRIAEIIAASRPLNPEAIRRLRDLMPMSGQRRESRKAA
jgi:hypothetical protein